MQCDGLSKTNDTFLLSIESDLFQSHFILVRSFNQPTVLLLSFNQLKTSEYSDACLPRVATTEWAWHKSSQVVHVMRCMIWAQ